ncbi:MAG: hypothetical protein JXB49_32345 [Bacteroidales bacterium]|nr:hypothetical protein [Bacteroidales bacterium]
MAAEISSRLLKYPARAEMDFVMVIDNQDLPIRIIWEGITESLTILEDGIRVERLYGSKALFKYISILLATNN